MSLHVDGVTVAYGRRPVIHALSLPPLQPGSLTALIGPNGAGKSTLLRGLAGLERLSGSLQLDGQDLTRLSSAERGRRIAYMPQSLPGGVALSVLDGLLASLRVNPFDDQGPRGDALGTALEALQRVGIAHLRDARLDRLSGGQRQLVSLAQLLARRPRVLLLDEPTSALDLNYQLRVMQCVKEEVRRHGLIGIAVLHDIGLAARHADHLAVLAEGRVVAAGEAEQVLDAGLFRTVYGVRARVERCSQGTLQVLVDAAEA
ncbi:MAG: Fe(3+) dicitrate transport ATP-binding protein FecE [Stenotrophomonas maltophilia]|nr:MAG: Fe(3+) dicitrate transport ATP-binding protein FecE [Stenotrophomonas maltophilia]